MAAPQYQLSMRSGPEPGKVFPLNQDEVRLGRDLGNDIAISDPEISRHHARLLLRDESVFLEDLGSTNGTFLNSERITNPQQLRVGDVITFGDKIVMDFEKVPVEQEPTLVADYDIVAPEARSLEPESVQLEPDVISYPIEEQEVAPEVEAEAVPEIIPEPELEYRAAASKGPRVSPQVKEKKDGLPTWVIVLIIAIVVLACVIAVTLYFMPASWWCAITFDMLQGCPVP
jgi:predicted component of type VI protein secretion system